MNYVNEFMTKFGRSIEVIWGTAIDDSLEEKVKVTVLATGFGLKSVSGISDHLTEEELLRNSVDEEKERKAAELIRSYYRETGTPTIGRIINVPKPIVLTVDQFDDDMLISLLEEHPAYCRDAKTLQQIKETAGIKSKNQPHTAAENVINFRNN